MLAPKTDRSGKRKLDSLFCERGRFSGLAFSTHDVLSTSGYPGSRRARTLHVPFQGLVPRVAGAVSPSASQSIPLLAEWALRDPQDPRELVRTRTHLCLYRKTSNLQAAFSSIRNPRNNRQRCKDTTSSLMEITDLFSNLITAVENVSKYPVSLSLLKIRHSLWQ